METTQEPAAAPPVERVARQQGAPAADQAAGQAGVDAWPLTDVITRLRRVLRASVRREFPWESLPMAQVEILQRLAEEPELGISELAARQRLATNTVSSLVQQMVTAQLVERRARPGDRRAAILRLTAAGSRILASWQEANARRLGQALDGLPSGHRDAIQDAIPALAALASLLEGQEKETMESPTEGAKT